MPVVPKKAVKLNQSLTRSQSTKAYRIFLNALNCDDITFHFDLEPCLVGDALSQTHTTEYAMLWNN